MHQVEGFVDVVERQVVCNELVNLDFTSHVILNKLRHTIHTLVTYTEKR